MKKLQQIISPNLKMKNRIAILLQIIVFQIA